MMRDCSWTTTSAEIYLSICIILVVAQCDVNWIPYCAIPSECPKKELSVNSNLQTSLYQAWERHDSPDVTGPCLPDVLPNEVGELSFYWLCLLHFNIEQATLCPPLFQPHPACLPTDQVRDNRRSSSYCLFYLSSSHTTPVTILFLKKNLSYTYLGIIMWFLISLQRGRHCYWKELYCWSSKKPWHHWWI